jgi:hypothetical protein
VAAAKGAVNEVAQGVAAAKGAVNEVAKGEEAANEAVTAATTAVKDPPHLSATKQWALKVAKQGGGAHDELSVESQIMGATILALIIGGSLKGLIDSTMTQ